MQKMVSSYTPQDNGRYRLAQDCADQTIIFTFLLIFFVKTFLTSGAFNSALVTHFVMMLNVLMLLYIGYAFFIATMAEKITLGIFILLFLVNLFTGHGDYLFGIIFSVSFVIIFSRVDLIRGGEIFVVAFLIAVLLMVIPYLFFTDSFVYMDVRYGNRLTLGFENPNTLAYYFFSFLTMTLCLLDRAALSRGMKNIVALVLAVIIEPILMYSYSRTCFVLSLLMLLVFWLAPLVRIAPGRKFTTLLLLALMGFQFISVLNWGSNPGLDAAMNEALTGRIWFAWQMYQAVGLPNPLFGLSIEMYKPIDFFYIAMTYSAGGAATLLMLYCYYRLLGNMRRLSLFMRWSVVIFLLITFTETYFLVPVFNVSLLLLCRGKENNQLKIMR